MTEFNVTVAESVNVFGGSPSSKWGDYNWNAFKWGEGTTEAPFGVVTPVSETQASAEAVNNQAAVGVSEAVTSTETEPVINVLDSAGYYHVFPSDTTNGDSWDRPTWTSGAVSAASWTTAALAAPTWS